MPEYRFLASGVCVLTGRPPVYYYGLLIIKLLGPSFCKQVEYAAGLYTDTITMCNDYRAYLGPSGFSDSESKRLSWAGLGKYQKNRSWLETADVMEDAIAGKRINYFPLSFVIAVFC